MNFLRKKKKDLFECKRNKKLKRISSLKKQKQEKKKNKKQKKETKKRNKNLSAKKKRERKNTLLNFLVVHLIEQRHRVYDVYIIYSCN